MQKRWELTDTKPNSSIQLAPVLDNSTPYSAIGEVEPWIWPHELDFLTYYELETQVCSQLMDIRTGYMMTNMLVLPVRFSAHLFYMHKQILDVSSIL